MAHVFIVDEKTFDVHIKYNFAGTGAKDGKGNYIIDNTIDINPATERNLTALLADISRIRKGDKILFYLQQGKQREGMFFGLFEAEEKAFLCTDGYLDTELGKKLIYRIRIKPDKVYPIGITERECLDSFEEISHPYELCWSLIYRKLKGNRGCTMITDAELEYMMKKIKKKNTTCFGSDSNLKFDPISAIIVKTTEKYTYSGAQKELDIYNRLKFKANKKNAFETHLQAYIMQNLEDIEILKVNKAPIKWIGNEMSCGVGMQSIDAIFMQEDEKMHIVICELKYVQPEPYIKAQIYKYIDWIEQFIVPTIDKEVIIYPTIIAPTAKETTLKMLNEIKIGQFKSKRDVKISKTRYISFEVTDKQLVFKSEDILENI